jgi:hypothetical protein
MHHDLNILPPYFEAKAAGVKPWEIRTTEDRTFALDDTVTFHEVEHGAPRPRTGRTLGPVTITYLLSNSPMLAPATCVFTHT